MADFALRTVPYIFNIQYDKNGSITTQEDFKQTILSQWSPKEILDFVIGCNCNSEKILSDISNLWEKDCECYAQTMYEEYIEYVNSEKDNVGEDEVIIDEFELKDVSENDMKSWIESSLDWNKYLDDFLVEDNIDDIVMEFSNNSLEQIKQALMKIYQSEPLWCWQNINVFPDKIVVEISSSLEDI